MDDLMEAYDELLDAAKAYLEIRESTDERISMTALSLMALKREIAALKRLREAVRRCEQ